MFASTSPEHFEGTIDYGTCRINGDECYGCVYCPPERIVPYVQHNEPNLILVAIRHGDHDMHSALDLLGEDAREWWTPIVSDAMIAHARRVLTRLAGLEARES